MRNSENLSHIALGTVQYLVHISATWDDFKVLGKESSHWLLEIKGSLFIKNDRPLFHKNVYSQEFFSFKMSVVKFW